MKYLIFSALDDKSKYFLRNYRNENDRFAYVCYNSFYSSQNKKLQFNKTRIN